MRRNPFISHLWDRRYRIVYGEPGRETTWTIQGPLTLRIVLPDGHEEEVALFSGTVKIEPIKP